MFQLVTPPLPVPWICGQFLSFDQLLMCPGALGVGTDYTLDTSADTVHRSTFDLTSYLSRTSASAAERIQRQLQAKEAQIKSRTELYEEQTTRLLKRIDVRCDELEQLQNSMARKDEEKQRVEQQLSRLYRELRETQQQFHRELRELEDERITLQAELDTYQDGKKLVALAEEWL